MVEVAARSRLVTIALAASIIASGLLLRRFGPGLGLPFVVVQYGGSLLWGMMVYLLLAATAVRRPAAQLAMLAALIAVSVELFRLYHTSWLDAFRLTTSGALLLGRVFSLWNLAAYGLGILLCIWIDLAVRRR
ncbi:DUF2809 domain-containing protein [Bosea sp. RAF48]|uniref:ribosomal maturation YjgA family protein n=1 Tax=Bosea sp. RAF48 TaxID=3237480 RepID=UPI003F8F9AED